MGSAWAEHPHPTFLGVSPTPGIVEKKMNMSNGRPRPEDLHHTQDLQFGKKHMYCTKMDAKHMTLKREGQACQGQQKPCTKFKHSRKFHEPLKRRF